MPPPLSLQGDRILKERGKFEIPLSLSGVLWLLSIDMERQLTPQIFDLAGGSYAQLSSLCPGGATPSRRRQKKKHPAEKQHLLSLPRQREEYIFIYPTRQRGIFISSAPTGAG